MAKLLRTAMAVAFASSAATAHAFHAGGVAECSGCHSMHAPAPGGSFLLVGGDRSSTCLTCHEHAGDTGPSSYHVSTAAADMEGVPPKQRTPGGDFGWLRKTYTWITGRTTQVEEGATHGHNIVAVDFGYAADARRSGRTPGGHFLANQLGCTSCHDPHGQYRRLHTGTIARAGAPIAGSGSYPGGEPTATAAVGVYRLLAGSGYTTGGVTFAGVPAAKVPSSYNRSEATMQTRAAYGYATAGGHVGWGEWCATCHTEMHSSGPEAPHPTDRALGARIATIYNQYVKTGDMSGTSTTSFNSLVPFVESTGDYTFLASHAVSDDSHLVGPTASDQVSCISCHRAHASGFRYMLRYDADFEFETMAGEYVGWDNPVLLGEGSRDFDHPSRGRTIADFVAAYYDRAATQFATYQRILCNKCHGWD